LQLKTYERSTNLMEKDIEELRQEVRE